MGVTGLWRLIEPTGKPVPLETLENKVLAVDISIWLHQAIKGFQDSKGAPLPNAHLLGIYHRVCKLLYFRIKPIFVFDGGVPVLKKDTIARRNVAKSKTLNEAEKIQKQLISTLLKHSAINKVIAEKAKEKIQDSIIYPSTSSAKSNKVYNKDELFILPEIEQDFTVSSNNEDSESEFSSPTKHWDLHTIDEKSSHFQSLPADVRHEILTELKETRKQSSWHRIHEIPKESGDFSNYQMQRLLKRFSIQSSLEDAEKEMGGHSLSIGELEVLLQDQGVVSKEVGRRIASDENTRFLLIKDIKKTMEELRKQEEIKQKQKQNAEVEKQTEATNLNTEITYSKTDPKDGSDDEELQKAIQLSLQCESELENDKFLKSEEKQIFNPKLLDENDLKFETSNDKEETRKIIDSGTLSSAKNYMMEYSGLTPNEIEKIIGNNALKQNKNDITKKVEIMSSIFETSEEEQTDFTNYEQNKNKDYVETISDSESSDDFLEVSTNENNQSSIANSRPLIEITINPINNNLDDDLFSDIFAKPVEDEKQEKNITEQKENEVHSNETVDTEKTLEKCNQEKIEFPIAIENDSENKSVEFSRTQNKENVVKELLESLKNSNRKLDICENNSTEENKNSLSTNQLKDIQESLIQQQDELITEKLGKERLATNITDQMYQEAQELLQLFGLPYIVAPMEAEAQCAFLDLIDLTDGTITDDSDIWLFGGKTVYKNFFNQSKRVLEFKVEEIQHHFKLAREQMILLALLVGSDYTVGIQGIGPVTALEILAAFPPKNKISDFSISQEQLLSGLLEFRSWLASGKNVPGKTSLRKKLKNVTFTENFPSYQVVRAYLDPKIDTSKEPFSWGKPNIVTLTDFAKEKFGWTRQKSEEILKPVVKKMAEKHLQKSILEFFKTTYKVHSTETESKMSKRVRQAIHRIGNDGQSSTEEEKEEGKKRKSKTKIGKNIDKKNENNLKQKRRTKENENKTKLNAESKEIEKITATESSDKKTDSSKQRKSKNQSGSESTVENKRKSNRKRKDISKTDSTEKNDNNKETLDDKNKNKNTFKPRGKVSDSTFSLSAPATEEIRNKLQQYQNETNDSSSKPETELNSLSEIVQPSTSTQTLKISKILKADSNKVVRDEEMKILKDTLTHSKSKIEQIRLQLMNELKRNTRSPKEPREIIRDVSGPICHLDKLKIENIHRKEEIPQKVQDQLTIIRSKRRAIEIFKTRKNSSKKKKKLMRVPNSNTHYLSESSSDD